MAKLTIFDAGLIGAALTFGLAVAMLAIELLTRIRLWRAWGVLPAVLGGAATLAITRDPTQAVLAAAAVALPVAAAVVRLRDFRPGGAALLGAQLGLIGFGLAWALHFSLTLPVSLTTRLLLLSVTITGLSVLPVQLLRTFENLEALCRRDWRRPQQLPAERAPLACSPRVSIHVPVHAEPPRVVLGTLDSLAQLEYLDFEVLVIDNNTADEQLWRPVQEHCRQLGDRFRFIHVEQLQGAKAGALNLAMSLTDPEASLVAVVDADYQVSPDFLSDLAPLFDDARLGFVQTPHAYRGTADRTFLSMCDWEYNVFFATQMVSINERDAAITVGTMCVIRRTALAEAGGWATWCLTEDSELAIRIHALGYSGLYLRQVYGRGLIPDTFAGYKAQRFRWTYGPVQELRHHRRLLLPGRRRTPSRLSPAQRLHHSNHGLYGLAIAVGGLMFPLGLALVASIFLHHERIALPFPLWLASTVMLASGTILSWLTYRILRGARLREFASGLIASASLAHVVLIANISAMLGLRASWRRTNKFPQASSVLRAFSATWAESALTVGFATAATVTFVTMRSSGLATFIGVGFILAAVRYGAAPGLALLAERDLRRLSERATGEARALPMSRRAALRCGLAVSLAAVAVVTLIMVSRADGFPGSTRVPEAGALMSPIVHPGGAHVERLAAPPSRPRPAEPDNLARTMVGLSDAVVSLGDSPQGSDPVATHLALARGSNRQQPSPVPAIGQQERSRQATLACPALSSSARLFVTALDGDISA